MSRPKAIARLTKEQLRSTFTLEQNIFLDKVKEGRKDPVYFANELLGVQLHDGQKLWLWLTTKRCPDKSFVLGQARGLWKDRAEFDALLVKNPDFSKNILVPANRFGKTFVTSVKHLYYCFYKIGCRGSSREISQMRVATLNLSPHSNQCQAGFDFILDILSSRLVYVFEGKSYSNECLISNFLVRPIVQKRQIIFKNFSSYRTIPTGEDQASSLAGTPYLYISYDECAQSLHLKEELPAKIMSRLLDFGGPLDLVSTPEVDKPSHQYFFHVAKLGLRGEDGWFTLVGTIKDNVFLGEVERDRIIKQIKSTDPVKYRQVVYGEFVTTGKKMYDTRLIEQLWDRREPEVPLLNHKYLISVDWGFSDTGDPTVFHILDYTTAPRYRLVFRESIRGGSPFIVLARVKMLQRDWNGAIIIHDAGAMGGTVLRKMMKEIEIHDLHDFQAGGGNKADMVFQLQVVMNAGRNAEADAEGKITDINPWFGNLRSFYIPELEEQLGNYQYNPEKGISDKRLEQDEVMALGMGIWWLEKRINTAAVKSLPFNPLAATHRLIFPEQTAVAMKVRDIKITEKRIF